MKAPIRHTLTRLLTALFLRQAAEPSPTTRGVTEYVICYAYEFGDLPRSPLVLVQKLKPAWQAGRLNLPGGKIEFGERPTQAAQRELREETGLSAELHSIHECGRIIGDDWRVYVMRCPCRTFQPSRKTDEPVLVQRYDQALRDPRLIPNLKIIIPLIRSGVTGWTLRHGLGTSLNITL